MATNYNQMAKQYQKVKEQPWRIRIELFSLLNVIGDVKGKKVIDVACGEGWLTRKLCKAGASQVVGIDISEKMIELARWQEEQSPLGIEYRVQDARELGPQGNFDLSISNWLLVYARNRAQLGLMCQGLANQLKKGGRFVTLITNPALYTWQSNPPDYAKYGFEVHLPDSPREGAPATLTAWLDGESVSIENYFLPIEAHEVALHEAGFRELAFHSIQLAPDPQAREEGDYWNYFLQYPLMILIDGIKE